MKLSKLCGACALLLATMMLAGGANAQPGLIPNADVETDADPDGDGPEMPDGIPDDWFHSSGVSYPDDNGPSAPGVKSIQLDSANQDWRSSTAPVIPGGPYIWSFDYKFLEGATGGFRADLRFFDGGQFEGEDAPFINASNIGQWQTETRMLNAPLFANGGDNPLADNVLDVRLSSNLFGDGNGFVRFDNVIVRLVPEPSTMILLVVASAFAAFGVRGRR